MEIKIFKKNFYLKKFIKNLSNNNFYIILNSEKRWFKTTTELFVFNEYDIKNYLIDQWHVLLEYLEIKNFKETIIIKNNHIFINIKCDTKNTFFTMNVENIISAVQKLLTIYLETKFKKNYFIIIDFNNYISNQKFFLKNKIYQIIKTMQYNQEPFHFEPMSNIHRKIIHELVKQIDGVASYSLGAGQNRHVVIKLKKTNSVEI